MLKFLILFLSFTFPLILNGQENFEGIYTDLIYKVDDYVYIGEDSLVISSTDSHALEKCKISLKSNSFSIDDGGMGFIAKSISGEIMRLNESSTYYPIVGPYGDKWFVVKYSINEDLILGIFHARISQQPVLNYTLFSNKKITRSKVRECVLDYLERERPNIKKFQLLEVDKYEISDHPNIARFIKKTMNH